MAEDQVLAHLVEHFAGVSTDVLLQLIHGGQRFAFICPVEFIEKLQGAVVAAKCPMELLGHLPEAQLFRLFLLRQLFLQLADAQLLALLPEVGEADGVHVHRHGLREVRQGVAAGEQQGVRFVLV